MRLFDAGQEEKEGKQETDRREGVRQRAAEIDQVLKDNLQLDETSNKLGNQIGDAQVMQSIHYKNYRPPGSKWQIEHAKVGADYVYQIFSLRKMVMNWKDVIAQFITAMDVIFPRSVKIIYTPPSTQFELKYFTIRVESVTNLPGWEGAIDRSLASLCQADAWPAPPPAEG